jgi:hypothetical protein
MTAVTLKYMANPVRSTSVATNGAEDEASSGSSWRKSCVIQSVNAPHTTMTASATLTVMTTSGQRRP